MIDVDHQISAVERTVGDRMLEAGTARVLTASQIYNATLEELWDACTLAERIPRWFMPISGDLRVGGSYQLEGNASGTIERRDPPRSFAATWEYGDEVTWVEVVLEPEGDGRTRLTLEHLAHVDDERWLQYGPGAVGIGWDLALTGLGLHLTTAAANDPGASAAWMASPEGLEFVTRSSGGWADASIATGTDATEARAAEERTTAFYTGMAADRRPAPTSAPAASRQTRLGGASARRGRFAGAARHHQPQPLRSAGSARTCPPKLKNAIS